ncbi:MAG TPA: ABC transporter permease, partial [Nitrospirae bacterium]|nr:ABC transporter permease [Nitrospirota bacterium]
MFKIIWQRFKRNKLSVIGLCIVIILSIMAIFAPLIAPYEPTKINVHNILSPPDKNHIFGTDELGRDLLSRMIWGARASLKVGLLAVSIAISIGILIGSFAGYYGGKVDALLMRFVDIMLAFPTFFLILAV